MSTFDSPLWEGVASHEPSGRRRILHGEEPALVLRRVEEQNALSQHRWQQQQSLNRRRQEQELLCRTPEEFQALACVRQQELEALWQSLLTLSSGLSADLPIPDWQVLLDQTPFTLAHPAVPRPQPLPPEPVSSDPRYQPELSRMDKLFKRGQEKKQGEALAAFHLDYENWQHNRHHIEQQNTALQLRYDESLRLWELRQQEYQEQQSRLNGRVEAFWQAYLAGEAWAVADQCDRLLCHAAFPVGLPEEWELEFDAASATLRLEYRLPAPSQLPRVARIEYDEKRKELVESPFTQEEREWRYDKVIYQLVLGILLRLCRGETAGHLRRIAFNGWLEGQLEDGHKGRLTLCSIELEKAAILAAVQAPSQDESGVLGGMQFHRLYRLQGMTPAFRLERLSRPLLPAHRGVDAVPEDGGETC